MPGDRNDFIKGVKSVGELVSSLAYQTHRALRAPVLVVYNIVKFTVLDAFALAIIATGGPPAFPDIPGHESDVAAARRRAREIGRAMDELLKVVSNAGSYVSESDFFERSWQQSFWGSLR